MGLLSKVLTFPVSAPVAGLKGLIGKIHETAEAQYYSAEAVRAQLVSLGEKLDRGEMTEEEYEKREDHLLDRLDEIDAYLRAKADASL